MTGATSHRTNRLQHQNGCSTVTDMSSNHADEFDAAEAQERMEDWLADHDVPREAVNEDGSGFDTFPGEFDVLADLESAGAFDDVAHNAPRF